MPCWCCSRPVFSHPLLRHTGKDPARNQHHYPASALCQICANFTATRKCPALETKKAALLLQFESDEEAAKEEEEEALRLQKAQAAKLSRAQFGLPEGSSEDDDDEDDVDEPADKDDAGTPATLGDAAEVCRSLHVL